MSATSLRQGFAGVGGVEERSQQGSSARVQLRDSLVVLSLLFVAFVAYALAWTNAPVLFPDSAGYMHLASDIANRHLTELSDRTPGYPLLLVLTGATDEPTRALYYSSLAMYLGTVYLLAYLLFIVGLRKALVLGFVLTALLPPFAAPATWVLTEDLTQCVLIVTYASLLFWMFTRRTALLALFILSATYCTFVRPTYELLVPTLAATALVCYWLGAALKKQLRRLIVSMAVAVVVTFGAVGAYSFLNYTNFGYFGFNSLSLFAMSTKTVGVIEFLPAEYGDLREILIKYRDQRLVAPFDDHMALGYIHGALPEIIQHYGGDRLVALRHVEAANWYLIKHKPASYVGDSLKLLGLFWMPNEYPIAYGESDLLRGLWALVQVVIVGAFFLQALTLAGIGLFRLSELILESRRIEWSSGVNPKLFCAYFSGMSIIAYSMLLSCFLGVGINRYRIPTDLLIVTTALIGFTIWARLMQSRGSASEAGASQQNDR